MPSLYHTIRAPCNPLIADSGDVTPLLTTR